MDESCNERAWWFHHSLIIIHTEHGWWYASFTWEELTHGINFEILEMNAHAHIGAPFPPP